MAVAQHPEQQGSEEWGHPAVANPGDEQPGEEDAGAIERVQRGGRERRGEDRYDADGGEGARRVFHGREKIADSGEQITERVTANSDAQERQPFSGNRRMEPGVEALKQTGHGAPLDAGSEGTLH